ncbi:hypothetical protein VIBNIPon4_90001 [Vibrio nigripulchritudo POn4]|nr:hypothetical protein VIBNIPon4_90001 [Vibrio nigripulchritudo POn4]
MIFVQKKCTIVSILKYATHILYKRALMYNKEVYIPK